LKKSRRRKEDGVWAVDEMLFICGEAIAYVVTTVFRFLLSR
jgi:hypothetical protein